MLVDTSVRCIVVPDIVIDAPSAFATVTTQEVSASTPSPVIFRDAPDLEILIPEPEVILQYRLFQYQLVLKCFDLQQQFDQ